MARLYTPQKTNNKSIPVAPSYLNAPETAEFNRVVSLLCQNNSADSMDVDIIAQYAVFMVQFLECKNILNIEGSVIQTPQGKKRHPAQVALTDLFKSLNSISAQLGLNAAARAKLMQEAGTGTTDLLDDLMSKRPQIKLYEHQEL